MLVAELDAVGPIQPSLVRAAISGASPRECSTFGDAFSTAASARAGTVGGRESAQLELLAHVSKLFLVPGNPWAPFRPMIQLQDRRSAAPEDFRDDHLDLFADLIEHVEPELRARLADLLWVRRRDHRFAATAVRAYLDSASVLAARWHSVAERCERALRLAATIARSEPLFDETVNAVRALLEAVGEPCLVAETGQVLAECRVDLSDLQETFSESAEACETVGRFEWARRLWELCATASDDEDERNRYRNKAAENFVGEADRAAHPLAADQFLRRSIEALRNVPGTADRRTELYARLRSTQTELVSQMQSHRFSLDASEMVAAAREAVAGKSLDEALLAFATLTEPPNYERLATEARERRDELPLLRLFGSSHHDQDGRVIAEAPPNWPGDDGPDSNLSWSETVQDAAISHSVTVQGIIDPARWVLLREHHVTEQSILEWVAFAQFVPQDRQLSFASGLHAGFHGSFASALHNLVPQIENSIRVLLALRGVETSALLNSGVQHQRQLGTLLGLPQTVEMLGKNVTCELRALLLEPTYANLRNRIAHGLVSDAELEHGEPAVYLWWLILRLVALTCVAPIGTSGQAAFG